MAALIPGQTGEAPAVPSAFRWDGPGSRNPRCFRKDVEALHRFRFALAQAPGDLQVRKLVGTFLLGQGDFSEARTHLEYLAAQGTADRDWAFHMAWALLGEGREAEAEAMLAGEADLCARLAGKASDLGRWAALERLARRASELQPDSPDAAFDHAIALDYLGDFQAGLEILARIEACPGLEPALLRRARMHRSQSLLLLGRLEEGFRLMEARRTIPDSPAMPLPEWDGSPLLGRPILLRAEQGVGDQLMFLRYAALLARTGAPVFVESLPGTRELLRTCPGIRIFEEGVSLPGGAVQAPLMSLAHYAGTTLESVPAPIPYLGAPEHSPSRESLARLLAGRPSPRIGLVWAGNPRHRRDLERSIPPGCLELLRAVPQISWFSLQKEARDGPDLPLTDLAPHLGDFADTALALSLLDGLVTVDTGVAHLAGAMGLPVWLLLPRFPDWRWLLERSDSPWYPSVRLFRQSRHWDWEDPLSELVRVLSCLGRPSSGR